MTDRSIEDAIAQAHDDEVYAVEQNAQNFEAIGCAIAVLQRTDSRRMPADVRKMIYEVRAKLSLAHSILIDNVASLPSSPAISPLTHDEEAAKAADEMLPGLGRLVREGKLVPDDGHIHVKAAPSLGAQLADLRTIIDKVEAARVRVAQRYMHAGRVTLAVDSAYDILDLLVDARQTAIDLRDEVERTLAGKFLTIRDLKVGDCFRFKDPPPGWTNGKLQLQEGHPGFAMPEGWDFFPIELLDGEVERISPGVIADEIRADGGIDIPGTKP